VPELTGATGPGRLLRVVMIGLIVVTIVFATLRISVDVPYLASGTTPDEGFFERRYVENPVLAYAHIVPGVIYLVGAPLQLARGFRERDLSRHRRLGRVLLPAGVVSGLFAVAFGSLHAFGGALEASASVVFGVAFVAALIAAYRAIRRGDVTAHRRWMIRAFALGLAVGTIRLWIGLFQATGLLSFEESFGVGFWLAFTMHAGVAELYLARRPRADGRRVRRTDRARLS
jgi:uncharacterized membrane protein YozB (DUF420 family)